MDMNAEERGRATGLRRAKFPRRQRLRRDASGLPWKQHPGWVRIGDWGLLDGRLCSQGQDRRDIAVTCPRASGLGGRGKDHSVQGLSAKGQWENGNTTAGGPGPSLV